MDSSMYKADNGGIDLTTNKIDVRLQDKSDVIEFQVDSAMLQQMQDAPGIVPLYINFQPMNDLKKFLG